MPVSSLNCGNRWMMASAYGCWLKATVILAPEACFQLNWPLSARAAPPARIAAAADAAKSFSWGGCILIVLRLSQGNRVSGFNILIRFDNCPAAVGSLDFRIKKLPEPVQGKIGQF